MFSFLPAALFVLLFSWSSGAQGISSNDPFRAIAVTVTKPESPPICCLKTLTPLEPLDDEVLLSFEDWKNKQQAAQQKESLKETDGNNQSSTFTAPGNASDRDSVVAIPDSNVSAGYISGSLQPLDVAPHFRVPITDRFNYADVDCSARVHVSHRSAKSPSSILSSKKDRYMLSPCNSGRERQFVVVELCDDIRIDTVQLANFEFFSGVFKDFAVSVAKTYSIDPDGWILAGTYRAKNVRGVQSFHPPTSLRDFYRFIRVDFLSHYGNEYYCPVSLLRVYGLTQLEEWKWDIWQAESRAKLEKGAVAVRVVSMPPSEDISTFSTGTSNGKADNTTAIAEVSQETENPSSTLVSSTSIPSAAKTESSIQANIHVLHSTIESSLTPSGNPQPSISVLQDSSPSQTSLPPSASTRTSPSPASISLHMSVPEYPTHESIVGPLSDAHKQSQVQSSNHTTINIPSSTVIPSHSSIPSAYPSPSVVQSHSLPPPPLPPAGESVYRTIMNRLTAVENNQTLYMKYVEQQSGAMRDVIKRLGEDVGRLEGITRAQGLALQKAINEWEKQRFQLHMEYKDILLRMEILSHEIILEKRLGVAQLCLLLAVLIFLGLTRGSRTNERFVLGQPSSRDAKTGGLREWGRRHLSWAEDKSLVAGRSSKTTDREGSKKGNDDRNRSRDRTREKQPSAKRPKPLVLGPSNTGNILRASSEAENSKLPFPSSDPLSRTTIGSTMNRPRTRTISHPRSRAGSGTTTPLYSAPITGNGYGVSRRMALQRPVTPTSRSHLAFRAPHGIRRSHSFSRPITPIGPAGGRAIPLPISQTSSLGGTFGVVSKSAKNWAWTAHLHDANSVKKKKEQELAGPEGKSKRENMETDVEDDDDVFLGSLKKRPNMALMNLDTAPEVVSSQRRLFELHHMTRSEAPIDVALPVEDELESDLWVDTDSASVDDSHAETFDLSNFATSPIDALVL